ncbi:cytochrome P450 [Phycomyces blakesleeanus]
MNITHSGNEPADPWFASIGMISSASAIVLGLLALKYPDRAAFYERRKGIYHSRGWPILGATPSMIWNKEVIHEYFLHQFEKSGVLTSAISSLGIPFTISTIDPRNIEHILKNNFENYVKGPAFDEATQDLLGHGIFNSNGERWKYQRKTASHIFNVKNFKDQFTDVFLNGFKIMSEKIFDPAVKENHSVDFHDAMYRFTLDSFILLGFGVHLKTLSTKEKVPFATSFDECQRNAIRRLTNPAWRIGETVRHCLAPWKKTIPQHVETINSFASDVIKNRRDQVAKGEEHGDLLSRFMKCRNEKGNLLDDTELRDTVLNFVIAGRDTTAQSLSWTFYNLMQNPAIEEKLLEEIREHITDSMEDDPPAMYEAIKHMTYAHAVFHETLRLHPSVPNNQKYALNDDIWPDGTHIQKGDYVVWSPWAQGRCVSVWGEDAKIFKPERWITPEGDLRRESQGQWPAFHGGPRVCLGQNLATLQALIVIVFLLKRYKLSLVPGQEITYLVSLTLPMKNGMSVMVEKRQPAQ